MNEEEKAALEQQRQRRNRITRMKNVVIVVVAGWMVVSFLAIIILTVQVVRLNYRIDKLTIRNESSVETSIQEEQTELENTESMDLQAETTNMPADMDAEENLAKEGDEHKVYLTFDGGPDENTNEILDILAKYNVKATFFVIGNKSDEMKTVYQRIVDEGHTLGMHSYSNSYSKIYSSPEAFDKDVAKLNAYLKEVTGKESKYYRFPGGSNNEISNADMSEFIHVLNEKQITYFDWNVSAGDTASDYSAQDIVTNVTEGVSKYKTSVVLLHDGDDKSTTVEVLGPLIEALQKMKAKILPIDENTNVIQYIKADSVE